MTKETSNYGIGVGLRAKHYSQFIKERPKSVNWVEVVTENFLPWNKIINLDTRHVLRKVREHTPVALHGVSMNLGSTDKIDYQYLKKLKELKNEIKPMWISDHICWTGVNSENLHDLMPLPYTSEALENIVRKVSQAQDYLGERIILENVSSYVEYEHSEMLEWHFISELSSRTGCQLLLDVNNVYVSSINHGFKAEDYIHYLKPDSVAQIHLAGHSNQDGFLIDTHGSPIIEDVWQLYKLTLRHTGQKSTMVERDSNIPEWEDLEKELLRAQGIYNEAKPN